MNIFVSSACPIQCAKTLDDKRVVKMILESAQLLSTALWLMGETAPCKPTHMNHPCAKWARQSRKNYEWLLAHFCALLKEYTRRYHRQHAYEIHTAEFYYKQTAIPMGIRTPFVNCTPFKTLSTLKAYNKTLREKWKHDLRPPTWYKKPNNLK